MSKFKQLILTTLATGIMIASSLSSFAISGSNIIIAEPTSEIINEGREFFLTVNISTSKVKEDNVFAVLVKKNNFLSHASQLTDLKVAIPKIIPQKELNLPYNIESLSNTELTPTLKERHTHIINSLFDINTLIVDLEKEYAVLNKNNDPYAKEIQIALSNVYKQRDEVQHEYNQLFEDVFMIEKIDTPSFFRSINQLPLGTYKIRFLDENGNLLKEKNLNIVKETDFILK